MNSIIYIHRELKWPCTYIFVSKCCNYATVTPNVIKYVERRHLKVVELMWFVQCSHGTVPQWRRNNDAPRAPIEEADRSSRGTGLDGKFLLSSLCGTRSGERNDQRWNYNIYEHYLFLLCFYSIIYFEFCNYLNYIMPFLFFVCVKENFVST